MTLHTKTLSITPSKALLAASPSLAKFLATGNGPNKAAYARTQMAYNIVTENW